MRWIVPALCVLAMLTAVVAAVGDEPDGSAGPEGGAPPPSASAEPRAGETKTGADALARLRREATEVPALPDRAERRLLDDCLTVPEGADPSLSPDPDEVAPIASGETEGAAVVVWVGPSPQYARAVGSCTALDRGAGWTVVGRSVRRDLGSGTPALVWQPSASDRGAVAALVGRVRDGTADLVVVLDDDRVLHQEPADGFVAIPWQPVRQPARLVEVRASGAVGYDGSLTGYASDR